MAEWNEENLTALVTGAVTAEIGKGVRYKYAAMTTREIVAAIMSVTWENNIRASDRLEQMLCDPAIPVVIVGTGVEIMKVELVLLDPNPAPTGTTYLIPLRNVTFERRS